MKHCRDCPPEMVLVDDQGYRTVPTDCPGIESAGGGPVAWGCEECGWSRWPSQQQNWTKQIAQDSHDPAGSTGCRAPVIPLGKLGGGGR